MTVTKATVLNYLLALLCWAAAATACVVDEQAPEAPTLQPSSLTLSPGETKEVQIIGGIPPFKQYKNSDRVEIAINGRTLSVKAVGEAGSAKVTVEGDNGGKAELSVTVLSN